MVSGNAILELMRRAVLVGGVFWAVWFAFRPLPVVLRVKPVDFTREKDEKAAQMDSNLSMMGRFVPMDRKTKEGINKYRGMSLDEFISQETRDRIIRVEGKEWVALYERLMQALSGGAASHWCGRMDRGYFRDAFYFRIDEAPLCEIVHQLGESHPFVYIAITGPEIKYLAVTLQTPRDARYGAPSAILYPQRSLGGFVAVLGVLVYILLPWPRRPHDGAYYSRVRAVILPDILGVGLASMFFALPILVTASMGAGLFEFDTGWAYMTLVSWAFSAGCLSLVAIAALYAAFRLVILPDRLRRLTLWSQEEYMYTDIKEVRPVEYQPPRWLLRLGFLVGLLNWRALGPTLIVAGQEHWGIGLVGRDGQVVRISGNALIGLDRVLKALRDGGVKVAPELRKLL